MTAMPTRRDPELYARLVKPRPAVDVDAAMKAFDADLYALRAKHGIHDLTWVAAVSVVSEEAGADGCKVMVHHGHYGCSANALPCVGAVFAALRKQQDLDTLRMAGIEPDEDP